MFKNFEKNLILKRETNKDIPFLFKLYSSTREDELFFSNWTQNQKILFLQQQFQARQTDYYQRFKDADFLIIQRKKNNIGRIIYDENKRLHLIDIAFLPKYRNNGYGTQILQKLIDYVLIKQIELHLSVATNNPKALKFYSKLGFKIASQDNFYIQMVFNKNS